MADQDHREETKKISTTDQPGVIPLEEGADLQGQKDGAANDQTQDGDQSRQVGHLRN